MPFILLVAGPNAAGKSTLLRLAVLRPKAVFVNADDPARELPESMGTGMRNFRAGRTWRSRDWRRCSTPAPTVILETTLAGRTYLSAIPDWRGRSYDVEVDLPAAADGGRPLGTHPAAGSGGRPCQARLAIKPDAQQHNSKGSDSSLQTFLSPIET